MADALQVEVVAADRRVWSGEAQLVVARTTEGDIGVMRGHQALLATLADGPVTVHGTDGTTTRAAVHGGFLAVSEDNSVSVLAEVAELAQDIDVERARAARERAAGDDAAAAAARRRAEVRLMVATGS